MKPTAINPKWLFQKPSVVSKSRHCSSNKGWWGREFEKMSSLPFFGLAGLLLMGCYSWWHCLEEQWVLIVGVIFIHLFKGLHLHLDLQMCLIILCVERRSAESPCIQLKTLESKSGRGLLEKCVARFSKLRQVSSPTLIPLCCQGTEASCDCQ